MQALNSGNAFYVHSFVQLWFRDGNCFAFWDSGGMSSLNKGFAMCHESGSKNLLLFQLSGIIWSL